MQLYVDTCTFALYTMINIVNPSLLVVVLIQQRFLPEEEDLMLCLTLILLL